MGFAVNALDFEHAYTCVINMCLLVCLYFCLIVLLSLPEMFAVMSPSGTFWDEESSIELRLGHSDGDSTSGIPPPPPHTHTHTSS